MDQRNNWKTGIKDFGGEERIKIILYINLEIESNIRKKAAPLETAFLI
jgi:hypothetical protein